MPSQHGSHESRKRAPAALLYVLRHGQTIWNAERRLQGRRDSPLTLRGFEQAKAMGLRLSREIAAPEAFRLVSSPLGRAWQTAAIVAETLGLPPQSIGHERRLAEAAFGDWEGRAEAEIEAADSAEWARRRASRWSHRPPGEAETYAEVATRVGDWLDSLERGEHLIVVGHGLAGRVLRGLYLGLQSDEILDLEEPQDALFRLCDGEVSRLDA